MRLSFYIAVCTHTHTHTHTQSSADPPPLVSYTRYLAHLSQSKADPSLNHTLYKRALAHHPLDQQLWKNYLNYIVSSWLCVICIFIPKEYYVCSKQKYVDSKLICDLFRLSNRPLALVRLVWSLSLVASSHCVTVRGWSTSG